MLQCLPDSVESKITISDARAKAEEVLASSLYKFCSGGAQTICAGVLRELKTMERLEEPNLRNWSNSTFYQNCLTRFKFFMVAEATNGNKVSGEVAAQQLWTELETKRNKKAKVGCSEVRRFLSFSWLLSPVVKQDVLKTLKAVSHDLQQVSQPVAVVTSSSGTGSPAKKKSKSQKSGGAAASSAASSSSSAAVQRSNSGVDAIVLGLFA